MIAAVAPAARSHLLTSLFGERSPYLPGGPVLVRREVLQQLEVRLPDVLAAWGTGFVTTKQERRKLTPPTIERDPDVTLGPLRDAWSKAPKPCKSALDDAKSVVRDFTNLYGNLPVMQFTIDDFDFFAEELRKLRLP